MNYWKGSLRVPTQWSGTSSNNCGLTNPIHGRLDDPKTYSWLVVEPYPSEKYESVGMIIPNLWKNKKCSKPPTNIYMLATEGYL